MQTTAQIRVGAIHIYDVRGLTADEATEAMENVARILRERHHAQDTTTTELA